MMKRLILAIGILLLASCVSMQPGDRRQAPVEDAYGARSTGIGAGAGFTGQEIYYGSLADTIVFFDYDTNALREDTRRQLDALLSQLRYPGDTAILLEGHTDERGTGEYNLGLGERRANAVRQYLVENGVDDDHIETVSYGDTRPAILGSNEEAYWQNRRVEIFILN